MIAFNQDRKGSFAPAKAAMDAIAKWSLPVTPEVYTVFYAAASGQSLKAKEELADLEKMSRMTVENVVAICRRHLIEDPATVVDDLSKRFSSMLSTIKEKLATNDVKDLETAIGALSNEIKQSDMPESVRRSLIEVVKASRVISARDKTIKQGMESSETEIAKLRKELEAARAEAIVDQLTGAKNRRAYDARMEELMEQSARMMPASLMIIDIDNFKGVNDVHGHPFGDAIIADTAKRIKAAVRESGEVYRLGGEEFAVLLPGVKGSQGRQIAEQVCKTIRSKPMPDNAVGVTIGVTVSIGVSERSFNDAADTLYGRADAGLYKSKKNGKNRVTQV